MAKLMKGFRGSSSCLPYFFGLLTTWKGPSDHHFPSLSRIDDRFSRSRISYVDVHAQREDLPIESLVGPRHGLCRMYLHFSCVQITGSVRRDETRRCVSTACGIAEVDMGWKRSVKPAVLRM